MMLASFQKHVISFVTLIALVFGQIAVSAYACPVMLGVPENQAQAADDSLPACHQTGMTKSGLCLMHCQDGQQIVNDSAPEQAPVILLPVFIISLMPVASYAAPAAAILPSLQHSTSPPHSIQNCCFRI